MVDDLGQFPSLDPNTGKLRPWHVPVSEDGVSKDDLEYFSKEIDLIDGVFWGKDTPPSPSWISSVRASGKTPVWIKQIRRGDELGDISINSEYELLFEIISYDLLTGNPIKKVINAGNARGGPGKSIYDIAKELGFTGTVAEYEKSVHGRDGSNVLPADTFISQSLDDRFNSLTGATFRKHLNQRGIGGVDYLSVSNTNYTSEIQALLNAARDENQIAGIPPGVYTISGLVIPERVTMQGWGGGMTRFGQTNFRYGSVYFRRMPGTTESMITVAGPGAGVENVLLDGRSMPGVALTMQGFESTLRTVRLLNVADTGLEVERTNNGRWYDVYVDNCGNETKPAVRIWSKPGVGHANETNTVDVYNLTIERSKNVGLNIAYDKDNQTGQWAEFVRITNLHMEAATDAGGVQNADPLIQIGNVRQVSFIDAFIYGGPGYLVEHNQTVTKEAGQGSGGIRFIGSTLLGADPNKPEGPSNSLVHLVRGNDFTITGGSGLHRYTGSAVHIEGTYGPNVHLGSSVSLAKDGIVDYRSDKTKLIQQGNTVFMGQIRGSGDRPTTTTHGGINAASTLPSSNGVVGKVFFGTTDNPPAAGNPIVTVNFTKPFETEPIITLQGIGAAAKLGLYPAASTTGFQIRSSVPLPINQGATALQVNYTVIG